MKVPTGCEEGMALRGTWVQSGTVRDRGRLMIAIEKPSQGPKSQFNGLKSFRAVCFFCDKYEVAFVSVRSSVHPSPSIRGLIEVNVSCMRNETLSIGRLAGVCQPRDIEPAP